ncbi:MAG: ATP phosphoribosyltransferase regulatory subunit [Thermoleophilaceae bacterium]
MIHPIPPGTRDMLPDEMREVRAITEGLRQTFESAGYGEVWTPALEYEEVLRAGDGAASKAGYRMFDEQGHVLALRSDMTIPIARVAATRYRAEEAPAPVLLRPRLPLGREGQRPAARVPAGRRRADRRGGTRW